MALKRYNELQTGMRLGIFNAERLFYKMYSLFVVGIIAVLVLAIRLVIGHMSHHRAISGNVRGLALVIIVAGTALILWQMPSLQYAEGMKKWPTVEGIVTSASITGGRNYQPEIYYKYTVGTESYEEISNVHAPGFGTKGRRFDVAETLVGEYPPGTAVIVFYDPDEPGFSTLKPGATWDIYGKLSLGIILLAIGLWMVFLPRRHH